MSKAIPLQNANVIPLHEANALVLPLAEGATLRVTPFRETPRVALSIFGPGGGDAGGVILTPSRARLLASWLVMTADQCEGTRPATRPPGHGPVIPLR